MDSDVLEHAECNARKISRFYNCFMDGVRDCKYAARYPSPRAASPIRIGGYPCRAVLESRESKRTTILWAIRAPHSTAIQGHHDPMGH